jgi:hypothetical protein
MPTPDLSEQLRQFAADLEDRLQKHAGSAGSDRRRLAAERLAAKVKRIAEGAPEAPADEASQQAVDQLMQMVKAVFPAWSPRVKGDAGEDE